MQTYFIRLRLLSPLQIGAGSLGMIEQTSLYIPSRVIWGAFTNILTQMLFAKPRNEDFVTVGNAVSSGQISFFFPEINGCRMCPVIPEQKWIPETGSETAVSFAAMESLLLDSAAATAITPTAMSAAGGTLHATDLIQPYLRELTGNKTPVCFSGYLKLPEQISGTPITTDLIAEVFRNVRLGGGRKRGWGIVAPAEVSAVDGYHGFTSIKLDTATLLTADHELKDGQKVCGEIRLASFREYDDAAGSGQKFSAAKLLWSVGSVIYD